MMQQRVKMEELVTTKETTLSVRAPVDGRAPPVTSVGTAACALFELFLYRCQHSSACVAVNGSCESSPCQNGGTCVLDGNTYGCICKDGWEGATCSISESIQCTYA